MSDSRTTSFDEPSAAQQIPSCRAQYRCRMSHQIKIQDSSTSTPNYQFRHSWKLIDRMTNVSTFEGLLSCVLIFICSCVHLRRVKALKPVINNALKQFGPLSIFHKASVIGIRLQVPIGVLCISLAVYIILR